MRASKVGVAPTRFCEHVDRRAVRPSVATASPVRVVASVVEERAHDPHLRFKPRIDRPQLARFGRVDELPKVLGVPVVGER